MINLPTIADAVATHARLSPNKLATRDSRRSLSWAKWHDRATRLAAALRELGLAKGERVG
ncbi:MAG: long-chain fatty acid--CoA ligase, partial [Betaproteobacteria bacterium]|nr:long-chain fatty acid--CoA ligase [Betaproteobacteria bacterium]